MKKEIKLSNFYKTILLIDIVLGCTFLGNGFFWFYSNTYDFSIQTMLILSFLLSNTFLLLTLLMFKSLFKEK